MFFKDRNTSENIMCQDALSSQKTLEWSLLNPQLPKGSNAVTFLDTFFLLTEASWRAPHRARRISLIRKLIHPIYIWQHRFLFMIKVCPYPPPPAKLSLPCSA